MLGLAPLAREVSGLEVEPEKEPEKEPENGMAAEFSHRHRFSRTRMPFRVSPVRAVGDKIVLRSTKEEVFPPIAATAEAGPPPDSLRAVRLDDADICREVLEGRRASPGRGCGRPAATSVGRWRTFSAPEDARRPLRHRR
jgi:hypothetical protein